MFPHAPAPDLTCPDRPLPVLEGLMPWLMSLLLHAAVLVLLAFAWIVIARQTPPPGVVGGAVAALTPPTPAKFTEAAPGKFTEQLFTPLTGTAVRQRPVDSPLTRQAADPGEVGQLRRPSGKNLRGRGVDWVIGRIDPPPAGRGYQVVYLLDASGSMIESLPEIKNGLISDLGNLTYDPPRGQHSRFNVVFFRTDAQAFAGGLLPATDANKFRLLEWLDGVHARGQTDPVPALKAAFSYQPDTIVILSDGEFEPEVLAAVEALQRGRSRKVTIHTVAHGALFEAPTLQKLAQDHGGKFSRLVPQ